MAAYVERAMLHPRGFNEAAGLPYGLRVSEVKAAIDDIYDFLHQVNRLLVEKGWDRLEETLSAAAFSGLLSELLVEGISKRSLTIVNNQHHNGRPDLVPRGVFENDDVLQGAEGIEVKASRWSNGWQGHNSEEGWIMICQYYIDAETKPISERVPTKFDRILCAQLAKDDWAFSGRGANSRRTPTASIRRSGVLKLEANAIYRDPVYQPRPQPRKSRQVVITETAPE
jgi:hypothetical protein